MLVIIDYKAGNLMSVQKALEHCGAKCRIASSAGSIKRADRIVLPGVGAFGPAMKRLNEKGIADALREWLEKGLPFLGICLGMQILFEASAESPAIKGLAKFEGTCNPFKFGKIPQIGWNQVRKTRRSRLLKSITDDSFFYFLHSYYAMPGDPAVVTGTTCYHRTYASVIEKDNVCAVQFHPEKSGVNGIQLLKNWLSS
jgi:glutamine amidotransferase